EAPMKDQPLPTDASPIALLPGYIDDSNLEEDEEDPEEDPVNYPANGEDNDDNESSDDDDDDDDPNKRQNTGRAYTKRHGEKKHYDESKPLCSKCNYHHDGPCAPKCHQCNKFGHLARDCRSLAATNNHKNPTCYECGNQGHYRSDCPELKNQDHGNQARGTEAHGMVHALGGGETNQNLNDVEDDINA
nr:hypothetical protein [Tanacetum cinerariifolium]